MLSSLLIAVILVIAAFFVGRKFASKPIEDRNEEIRQEKQKILDKWQQEQQKLELQVNGLEKIIENKKHEVDAAEQSLRWIKIEYQEKLKVIQNTKELADEELSSRRKILENEFNKDKEQFQNQKLLLIQEIEHLKSDLDSLQSTKQATLEAIRKEEEIKANKDFYTLQVPKTEHKDIEILKDTRARISKPRAISMVIWTAYYQQIAKVKFPKILGKTDVCGIYKITNLQTEQCYIGQSKDVRKRWYEHVKASIGIDTPTGNKLYAAIQKYGIENFTFELLEECPPQDLDKKEKYFIELYQSDSLGYNGNKGIS